MRFPSFFLCLSVYFAISTLQCVKMNVKTCIKELICLITVYFSLKVTLSVSEKMPTFAAKKDIFLICFSRLVFK